VSEQEDRTLSELYQQADDVTSPQHLDDSVLAMAKLHAEENRAKPWFQVQSYGAIASACVVVIALSVIFIQPNPEQTLNEELWLISPDGSSEQSSSANPSPDIVSESVSLKASPSPSSEQSSFAAPSPNAKAKTVSSVGAVSLQAVPASLNVAEKTVQMERKQEIIVASPENYLDGIEQLIKENKLADAHLRFNEFASEYPKLAQFQNDANAMKKLKDTNVSAKQFRDEPTADRDSSRLMGFAAESDLTESSADESELAMSTSAKSKSLNNTTEQGELQQRVKAIIHALSSVSKMPE